MAQQLAPRSGSSDVCSKPIYAPFMKLQNFAPAVEFCSVYLAKSQVPSTSGCPRGNLLCSILSSLSRCDREFISTVCSCIGVKPSVTISVPKTSSTPESKTKKNPKTTPVQSPTVKSSSTKKATSKTSSRATASTTSAAAPVCSDAVIAVVPSPDGSVCQQRGRLNPEDPVFDETTEFGSGGGMATSENDCARQCLDLQWDCASFEYNPDTRACFLFFRMAETENFVADDMSPFLVSDQGCFGYCPVCSEGTIRRVPFPKDLICGMPGLSTISEVTASGSGAGLATSVNGCAQRCFQLGPECNSFDFNPDSGACLLFTPSVADAGFTYDGTSPFFAYDASCFAEC